MATLVLHYINSGNTKCFEFFEHLHVNYTIRLHILLQNTTITNLRKFDFPEPKPFYEIEEMIIHEVYGPQRNQEQGETLD